ncbi:hydroxymethylglutaryl-CoA lyase [Saccharopolyspora shandongensis]|uniref:hydroxymethylglutaryl-CoA lyase n=1 Tax=Saccharopolyspora shandongensis TaxID=418495 RepID=UPI003423401C
MGQLLDLGVPSIEIGSLVRPDLVPSMANTLEVIEQLEPDELVRCWVWVATPRHVERAAAAGAVNFQYCLSASDRHNEANIGRPTQASLDAMPQAVEHALGANGQIQPCIATAFTCPFEGQVPQERVLKIASDARTEGAAVMSSLVGRIAQHTPPRRIVYHGHDTWGLGAANSLAAAAAGAVEVDGALGGLGCCPFAPGASGNAACAARHTKARSPRRHPPRIPACRMTSADEVSGKGTVKGPHRRDHLGYASRYGSARVGDGGVHGFTEDDLVCRGD